MLFPQEILPEEITGAEEAGKQGQGLFSLQKLQSFSIAGLFQDAVQKPIEVVDRLCRVRRRSEEMRELLDQRRRQPQLLLLGRIHDLAPMPAAYVKTVVQLCPRIFETGLADVNASHGERVGKGVQEPGRVDGSDIHDGVAGGCLVVEPDLNRVQQAGEGGSGSAERLDQTAVHAVAGVLKAVRVEQPDHAVEFVHKQALLIGGKRHSRQGADLEDVHDFLSGNTGFASRPVAWDRATQ